jgi:hypothetical protein
MPKGAHGHTEDGGEVDPELGGRDGGASLALPHHVARGDDAHRHEGAVHHGGQHPAGHQHAEAGRQGTDDVAQDEDGQQAHQQRLAAYARGERGDQRAADHHRQRVRGHQQAGHGQAHGEVGGEIVQHAAG